MQFSTAFLRLPVLKITLQLETSVHFVSLHCCIFVDPSFYCQLADSFSVFQFAIDKPVEELRFSMQLAFLLCVNSYIFISGSFVLFLCSVGTSLSPFAPGCISYLTPSVEPILFPVQFPIYFQLIFFHISVVNG